MLRTNSMVALQNVSFLGGVREAFNEIAGFFDRSKIVRAGFPIPGTRARITGTMQLRWRA